MRADLLLPFALLTACGEDPEGSSGGQRPEPRLGGELRASEADVTFGGAPAGSSLGWQIAGVGDLDGDGREELVVSAPSWPTAIDGSLPDTQGRVWLVQGAGGTSPSVVLGDPTWVGLDGDHLGFAVAAAGDLDGDDRPDIALGAIGRDGPAEDAGALLIPGALPPIVGREAFDFTGSGVAPAGDLDGDGHDDVLVGAVLAGTEPLDHGEVAVYSGPAAEGPKAVFAGTRPHSGVGDLASFAAMDLDGDGRREVAVAAWGFLTREHHDAVHVFTNDGGFSGEVPVDDAGLTITGTTDWYGYLTVGDAGDVDGDGLSELLVGRSATTERQDAVTYVFGGSTSLPTGNVRFEEGPLARIEGDHSDFWQALGAGDLDGDGLSDIVVGAPDNETLADRAGSAAIFYGARLRGTQSVGDADLRIFGEHAGDRLGQSVTTTDHDGDGLADLVIGGYGADENRGAVWLFYGRGL